MPNDSDNQTGDDLVGLQDWRYGSITMDVSGISFRKDNVIIWSTCKICYGQESPTAHFGAKALSEGGLSRKLSPSLGFLENPRPQEEEAPQEEERDGEALEEAMHT